MYDPGKYIILTAVSDNMWDDYLVFYESIRRFTDLSVIVTALEISDEHKKILSNQINVVVLDFDPEEFKTFKTIGGHWCQWFKPFYIKKCIEDIEPQFILWIDVDTVILQPLDVIFKEIADKFVVIRDYFAPETTINDPKLYKKYKCDVDDLEKNRAALNSGVLGFNVERDRYILDLWIEKVDILLNDIEAREWVRLFDQGALLWAMRELDILHLIKTSSDEPGIEAWNYPAKRNVYESTEKYDYLWPGKDDQIGGDLINNIRLDNPRAVIAHYAGLLKLSHLCEINSRHSIKALQCKPQASQPTQKLFCVGLERCGTHSFAEIIRRSTVVESWVRHEHRPCLAEDAFTKFQMQEQEQEFMTEDLNNRLALYRRSDCKLVCESNHRLSFFIKEINEATNGTSKFVLLLRNPLDLIASRLYNFALWPGFSDKYPGFYQFSIYELRQKFGDGSSDQNIFRIRHSGYLDSDIIDLHLWEINKTLDVALKQLRSLRDDQYRIVWLEDIRNWHKEITQLINPSYFQIKNMRAVCNTKYGEHVSVKTEIKEWANELIINNRVKILTLFAATLHKHGVPLELDFI